MPRTSATDPATKARALQRAGEVGAAQAGRELGIPSGTIRAWRTRAEAASPPTPDALPADVEIARVKKTATAARDAADEAIAQLRRVMPSAKSPQSLAIAVGVLMDKAILLDSIVQGIEEREQRLSEATGQQLAAVIDLAFRAVGVPLTPAVRAVVSELLRQAAAGGPLSVSPAAAAPARADAREAIRRELAEECADLRGLPAPVEDVEEFADVVEPEPEPSEEIVTDAEVVEDPTHPTVGSMRRRPWTSDRPSSLRPDRDPHGIFSPGSNMRHPGGGM